MKRRENKNQKEINRALVICEKSEVQGEKILKENTSLGIYGLVSKSFTSR